MGTVGAKIREHVVVGAELVFMALNEEGIKENSFFVAAEFTLCLFMMVSRSEFLGGVSFAVVS